jgi:hypothetical protein
MQAPKGCLSFGAGKNLQAMSVIMMAVACFRM